MARKFDYKKLLVEKGELVGIISAGALTLMLALWALIATIRAESPAAVASKLDKEAQALDRKLRTPPAEIRKDLLPSKDPNKETSFTVQTIDLPARYHGDVFASAYPVDDKARQPRVYPFADTGGSLVKDFREGRCVFEFAQLRSYIFNEKEEIAVLEDKKGTGTGGKGIANPYSSANMGGPRGPGGRPGIGAMGGLPGRGAPVQPPDAVHGKQELKRDWKKLDELDTLNSANYRLAETVRPTRMVTIVASFPYRDQLKEFCAALNQSPDAVLNMTMQEPILDPDGKPTGKEKTLPAFRFKGVLVQRRQVEADGTPIPAKGADGKVLADGWEEIPMEDAYRSFIYLSGKRTAPDDPALEPVLIDGLAMPRLLQMRDKNTWKAVEGDLENIKAALKPFNEKGVTQRHRPKAFTQDDDFSPFNLHNAQEDPTRHPPGAPGTPPMPGMMPKTSGGPRPPGPGDAGTNTKVADPVQFALIRLIDVTNLQPGKIYQYRIKVRMANPNFRKPPAQVADPKYADISELLSEEWYVIPGYAIVPPELTLYAVDQATLDKKYEGINHPRSVTLDPKVSTVVQIHRWIDQLQSGRKGGPFSPVGEWSIAERIIVNRGEAIDREVKVLVPQWNTNAEAFVLAGNAPESEKDQARPKGVPVWFGSEYEKSILLDFDNGDYTITRNPAQPLRERARTEVLVLTPDGRLQAHDSATDAEADHSLVGKERAARLAEWRARIEEVRNGLKGGPMGPMGTPTSPFGR